MENSIRVFDNPDFGNIRIIMENDKPLFCGSDVAKALGYANAPDALTRHCRYIVKRDTPTTQGNMSSMAFIPEGDLYRLITHSKLPSAEKFERWIFDEVLPSIRQTGMYLSEKIDSNMLFKIAQAMHEKEQQITALEEQKAIMQPKAQYYDVLVERDTNLSFRNTAKEIGVPEKQFVRFLLEAGYVYRSKSNKLEPYAEHVKNGLFVLKESKSERSNWSGTQTLITVKGRGKLCEAYANRSVAEC